MKSVVLLLVFAAGALAFNFHVDFHLPNIELSIPQNLLGQQLKSVNMQVNKFRAMAEGEPSAACQSTLQKFAEFQTKCGDQFDQLEGGNGTAPTQADIKGICESSCFGDMRVLMKELVVNCADIFGAGSGGSGSGDFNLDQFTELLNLVCLREGSEYCYPKLASLGEMGGDGGEGGNLTVAQLDAMCHPCVLKMIKALIKAGAIEADNEGLVMLPILCTKHNGQYCLPKLQAVEHEEGEDLDPTKLNQYCDFCVLLVVGQLAEIQNTTEARQSARMINTMCRRDPTTDQFCLVKVQTPFIALESCETFFDRQECPTNCSALVKEVADAGCCGTVPLELAALDEGLPYATIAAAITTMCSKAPNTFTFSTQCDRPKKPFNLPLRNLKKSYYEANKASVDAKVQQDVATNAGVATEDVKITGYEALKFSHFATLAEQGVLIKTEITATSTAQLDTIVADMGTKASSGDLLLTNISELPSTAAVDPTTGAGDTTTSGASMTTASLIVGVASVAMSLLLA